MKFSQSDTESLLNLMRWRRDVRHFKRDPVSDDAIQKLKEALSLAPSVGNSRPWRIVEIAEQDLRETIAENHGHANKDASSLYEDETLEKYHSMKLAGLKEAPLQLAIFTDVNPEAGSGLGRQTMPETLVYSTITAIHQLWLVARTLNIGVGWVSILQPDNINATLGVNPEWQFTAYLCIGYPEYDDDTPELVRTGWQENTDTEWLKR